ncbi:MAG: VWA domain-containing protein [Dehalococcoidia bacterium]|nr:VWA domain-containing protein [Dehalococcoidia bacterium]
MPRWPLSVLALLAGAVLLLPQNSAQAEGESAEISFFDSSGYPTIRMNVPVVDGSGAPVRGLTAEDFAVTHNGTPAAIASVQSAVDADIGAGVVLVIDVSGSMRGAAMDAARAAATAFVNGLSPNDRVAIVAFSHVVQLVQPFTSDKAAANAIIAGLEAAGDTALYEVAEAAVEFAQQSGLNRQAVIILSDGANDDPDGGPAPEEVIAAAAEVEIPFFAVALGEGADATFTQQLAEASGGQAYIAADPSQLPELYGAVAERLNSEYVIEYQSPPQIGEQAIELTVDASGTQLSATTELDVLWASSTDQGGPTVELPGFEPGSSVAADAGVSVTAANAQSVEIFVDGVSQAIIEGGPFEYLLEPSRFTPGRHELRLQATDAAGRLGRYDVIVEVGEAPPKVVLRGADGASVRAGDPVGVEVFAQESAPESVTVVVGGERQVLAEQPYVAILPDTLPEGENAVEAIVSVDGEEVRVQSTVDFIAPEPGRSLAPLVPWLVFAIIVGVAGYLLLKSIRQRALRRDQAYVPGLRDTLAPLAASQPVLRQQPGIEDPSGPPARLRGVQGPLQGKAFFLGRGSAVIGTGSDATIRVTLSGLEAAPELIRIWARDGKYMFHQVVPGPVKLDGREVQWAVLESGDTIQVLDNVFVFEIPEAHPAASPMPGYRGASAQA